MGAVTVETAHSTYHFDTDAQTLVRQPSFKYAARLDGDGAAVGYEYLLPNPPVVGEPMMIGLINGKTRHTTAVKKVTS